MDYDDVRGAGSLWQRSKKALQRMDAAGGSPDENDYGLSVVIAFVPGFIVIGVVVFVVGHGKYSALPPNLNTPENYRYSSHFRDSFARTRRLPRPDLGPTGHGHGLQNGYGTCFDTGAWSRWLLTLNGPRKRAPNTVFYRYNGTFKPLRI